MTDNFTVLDCVVRDYSDASQGEKLWALCPGSNTVEWIKTDKSNYSPVAKAAGHVIEPLIDIFKVAFYSAILYGLYQVVEKSNVIQLAKEGIEKLL